jgi:hypothetical protein
VVKKLIWCILAVGSVLIVPNLYSAIGGGPGGISINFIENQGSTVTQRQYLNFTGTGVTAVDNSTMSRTDVIINGSTGTGGGLVVTGTPQINYEVVWNGSGAVWAAEGTSFSFGINSFSDSQPGTIEEGVGVWKSTGNISFTASYNNGPATGGYVSFGGWSNLTLTNTFQGPTVTVANTNFPSVGGTVVFTLNATNGTSSPTATITHTFNNDRYYGVSTLQSGWTSGQVLAFGTNDLVNSIPNTFTVNPGAGQYIVNAYPSRLGTSSYSVGGFSGGFNSPQTVSVTNASGFTENYYVYSSVNSNLGSTTVVVTTP